MTLLSRLQQSHAMIMYVLVIVIITDAIETDIFVPSFPEIMVYFDTTEAMVQLIIGCNFIGLCLSSLLYGPLCDAYGRRICLQAGNIIFLLASIGCLASNTMESLLFWRFMQGLGTGVGFVVPAAIIFDLYTKEEAAKVIGFYSALITFAMAFAPIVGNYLNIHFGWQANFILIVVLSVISLILTTLFIKETLPINKRTPIHYKSIWAGYTKILCSKETLWYIIIISCLFSGYIIYITNLSLVFIDHLGVSTSYYGYYQGSVLLIYAIISFFCGRIIQFLGVRTTRFYGLTLNVLGGFLLLGVAWLFPENALYITLAMCVYCAGFALSSGIIFTDFMDVFPDIKGLAAALCTFVRLLFMAGMIGLSGILFDGTIVPVALMIAAFCVVTIVCMLAIRSTDTH